jgi:hypothetical protein
MKLPNSTKKWRTRATLFTTKIMSLIKKKDEISGFRLDKIRDHKCTNWGIKLKEN